MSKYFHSDGLYLVLDWEYCEFFIPQYYYEGASPLVEDLGNTINAFGVFNVGFYTNGKLVETKLLNLPTMIRINQYDSEKRTIDLPGLGSTPCNVLKFYKGNKVMEDATIEDAANATMMLMMITRGKIPGSVPYTKALDVWRKNQEMNKVHFGVSSLVLEIILAAAYRQKDDLSKKFAYAIGKNPDISPFDYIMASIRQICQYSSTYTAMTFEDMNSMITSSLNKARNKTEEAASPIEKIIKM